MILSDTWRNPKDGSDIANLTSDRINCREKLISFYRDKLDERETPHPS